MGVRRDKGRALARYMLGGTGIPYITWDGASNALTAPPPYRIEMTTSRSLENWHDTIRGITGDSPHMAIRYDNSLPDVSQAWVAMKLSGFLPLLTAHYETIKQRIEGE